MSLIGYNPGTISTLTTTGDYHHVALTISGNIHTIYLDGSAVAINSSAGNIFNSYNVIQQLYIGCAGDLSYGFTGNIDDFKVFNRALPSSDISAIYNNTYNATRYSQFSTSIASSGFYSDTCFNQICITDNGNVAIATTRGAYYSKAIANSVFTLSDLSGNIVSMSMNNVGNALCCTTTQLYYSTNYGVNWTATTLQRNSIMSTYFLSTFLNQQVIVTQTGLQYLLVGNTASDGTNCSNIFNSSDLFNTNSTNMNLLNYNSGGYGDLDVRNQTTNPNNTGVSTSIKSYGSMYFASNGCGLVSGHLTAGWKVALYYNSKNNLWNSNKVVSGYTTTGGGGVTISDNGKYIVMYGIHDSNGRGPYDIDGTSRIQFLSYTTANSNDYTLPTISDSNINYGVVTTNNFKNIPYYINNSSSGNYMGVYSHVTIDNLGNAYFSTPDFIGIYRKFNFFSPAFTITATNATSSAKQSIQTLPPDVYYKPYTNSANNFTTIALSSNGKYTMIMDKDLNQVIYTRNY